MGSPPRLISVDDAYLGGGYAVMGDPDREAIARVISEAGPGATLHFNYRTEFNDMWDSSRLRRKHAYSTQYPKDESDGIGLDL
mgnify:CR=1 FL=1